MPGGKRRGTTSRRSPNCFPLISGISRKKPVMLPPGRARVLIHPLAMGSLSKSWATMGILLVASLAAATRTGPLGATITSTLSPTRSRAAGSSSSGLKLASRNSMRTFLPSVYPASVRPRRNAASRGRVCGAAGRLEGEEADHRHRRLLRVHGEWPSDGRPSNYFDEIASSHLLPP